MKQIWRAGKAKERYYFSFLMFLQMYSLKLLPFSMLSFRGLSIHFLRVENHER